MEIYTTPVSLPDSFGFGMPQSAGDYLIAATAASTVAAKKRDAIDENLAAIRNGTKAGNSDPNTSCAATKKKKSRDGCQTCKNKRLKCDETKPLCRQCQKRGVQCEGYKKEYKWRLFNDSSIGAKAPKAPKKSKRTFL